MKRAKNIDPTQPSHVYINLDEDSFEEFLRLADDPARQKAAEAAIVDILKDGGIDAKVGEGQLELGLKYGQFLRN